jgi:hypothetical protein
MLSWRTRVTKRSRPNSHPFRKRLTCELIIINITQVNNTTMLQFNDISVR